MPLTLLRLAGKFSPPTVAVQYSSRGSSKVFEMPVPESLLCAEDPVSVIVTWLKAEHASVFAKLAIPDEKLYSTVLRVVEGWWSVRRVAALTPELCGGEAGLCGGEAGLCGGEPGLDTEPETDHGEPELADLDASELDLLRASINSFGSHSSRGSQDRYCRQAPSVQRDWFGDLDMTVGAL
jgi:hypothetical protein